MMNTWRARMLTVLGEGGKDQVTEVLGPGHRGATMTHELGPEREAHGVQVIL